MASSTSIKKIKTTDLIPYANNSRTHSDEQVLQIASSIKEFGFLNPVIIDADNGIIAGHGRVMAAKKLGIDELPCIDASHLTEAQKKAYIIADNKLALNAGWDDEILRIEFDALKELDFDLELTGFSLDEIDGLEIEEIAPEYEEDADGEITDPPAEPVTKEGDVWILGKHRLMCGDSTSIDAVDKLMDGIKPDMVNTDPPYGISIVGSNGHVGGGGLAKVNTYAPIAGDDTIDVAMEAIHIIKTLGAKVEIIWGGNYYANHLNNSSCWIVWDKQNTGNFADCELAWTNQDTAVRMFSHMWNGMIKASEHGQKRVHPTQKPVALAEWCIENYGKDCETILDLFGGSGFTLIASEKKDKSSFTMELSPHYCDVIINRWQTLTGKDAVLESTGDKFNDQTA
jgi:hypothetical protein